MWKRGGATHTCDMLMIQEAREKSSVYQEWYDYNIVTIFKKGDRPQCVNFRGILLLPMSGTSFARILLNRLNAHIAPTIVQETPCGFWNIRNTLDMLWCLRQKQEKSIGQQLISLCSLCGVLDTFDTVGRTGLWQLLWSGIIDWSLCYIVERRRPD